MRTGGQVGQASALCGLLALSSLASQARALESPAATSDAPTIASHRGPTQVCLAPPGRDDCLACFLPTSPPAGNEPWGQATHFLLLADLALRLDGYLCSPGRVPSPRAEAGPLRLLLLSPASPSSFLTREPQELDSLSVHVLEVRELRVVATARQQGRGGLWAELVAGDAIMARATGFLTSRGTNTNGATWFATHLLEVRSAREHFPTGAPALFAFVSQENGLTRDAREFLAASMLPGLGLGLQWQTQGGLALTLTTGANAGPWIDLKSGAASPGFSVNFQSVSARY